MSDANLTKIVFEIPREDSEEVDIETPWAEYLGDGRYRLRNTPYFAYGASFEDIIRCERKYEDDSRPYFVEVLEKSGHRTLRVILDEPVEGSKRSKEILERLARMDCGYDGNGHTYFAVNVQPHCDFESVCRYLTEQELQWEHADPTYDELYGGDT
jgi:hypothetical protein